MKERDIAKAGAARVALSRRRSDRRFPPLVRWRIRVRPPLTGGQTIPRNDSLASLLALERERLSPAMTLFHEEEWGIGAASFRRLRR